MRPIHLAASVVSAVLALSCSGRTDTTAASSSPSFDFTNGPASPGNSGIFRFQGFVLEIAVDGKAGLVSFHGLQNTIADFCNGLGQLDLMDFQVKPHSAGEVEALIVDRVSSVQIVALPANPTDLCTDLSGAPVLYRGTAAFHRTDNNFTPTGTEGGRADSFGWTSEGKLDDLINGGQASYSEEVRLLINPKTNALTVPVSKINVH
jgi:hypothetical protein